MKMSEQILHSTITSQCMRTENCFLIPILNTLNKLCPQDDGVKKMRRIISSCMSISLASPFLLAAQVQGAPINTCSSSQHSVQRSCNTISNHCLPIAQVSCIK